MRGVMRRLTLVIASLGALAGCASAAQQWRTQADRSGVPASSGDGPEVLYQARCKACHGEDGKHHTMMGTLQKMPDLTDPGWQAGRSDEEIQHIITNGSAKPGSRMVGFAGRLAPEEIDRLVPYVRQMKGN